MKALRAFRHSKHLSQEKMAQKIGITMSYYQQVERRVAQAGVGFIKKFLAAFPEQSSDIFFENGGDENAANPNNR